MLTPVLNFGLKLAVVAALLVAATAFDVWPRTSCRSSFNAKDQVCTFYVGR